jgi:hypothetical protein
MNNRRPIKLPVKPPLIVAERCEVCGAKTTVSCWIDGLRRCSLCASRRINEQRGKVT